MPLADGSGWMLTYADVRSSTRMLVSLPPPMLRDLHLFANSKGISAAELVRRLVTQAIAAEIQARPEIAPSFRGCAHALFGSPEKQP